MCRVSTWQLSMKSREILKKPNSFSPLHLCVASTVQGDEILDGARKNIRFLKRKQWNSFFNANIVRFAYIYLFSQDPGLLWDEADWAFLLCLASTLVKGNRKKLLVGGVNTSLLFSSWKSQHCVVLNPAPPWVPLPSYATVSWFAPDILKEKGWRLAAPALSVTLDAQRQPAPGIQARVSLLLSGTSIGCWYLIYLRTD